MTLERKACLMFLHMSIGVVGARMPQRWVRIMDTTGGDVDIFIKSGGVNGIRNKKITNGDGVRAVTVSVSEGLLQGEQLLTVTGDTIYYSFKGIQYAAPPVGDLRFQDPRPPASWNGIRNATRHGNTCTQVDFITQKFIPGSEDCLYLNVYTPRLMPITPLPVLFFFHGGGFKSGSGNDDRYGPDFFMSQNVILVTSNYRLGALGFLSLESKEVPGNAGMKDQVAALRWVQRNIAQFGGNPTKVTLIGNSAGGVSCLLHAVSPMSKGLFNRVIAMSGTPLMEYAVEFEAKRRGITLGKILGYETENTTALFEYFLTLPASKLLNTMPSVVIAEKYINNAVKMFHFVPVAEKDFGQERFLIEPPITSLTNGRVNNVDLIIGYSNGEGLSGVSYYEEYLIANYNRYPELLVPRYILYQRDANLILDLCDDIKEHYFGTRPISINAMPEFVNFNTDIFIYQILRYIRDISIVNKKKTFVYRFSGVSERNVYGRQGLKYGLSGAGHYDIEMYLFQANMYNTPIETNTASSRIINQITTLFANFAKYGNPTPDTSLGVIWEQYNITNLNYLDIGLTLNTKTQPEAHTLQFWKNLYNQARVDFYHVKNP